MITELWAVHVKGPDDILPMPDRATAHKKAAELNELLASLRNRADVSPHDPRMAAEVVPWDGDAEDHAVYLAQLIAEGEYLP